MSPQYQLGAVWTPEQSQANVISMFFIAAKAAGNAGLGLRTREHIEIGLDHTVIDLAVFLCLQSKSLLRTGEGGDDIQ